MQQEMSHTKYATISFHMSISHSVMHCHGVICVTNQHGFNVVCFGSNSFTLIAIIGSILCAELIHILCSLQIAYVYNFCPIERLIIEHVCSVATTSKLG